MVCCLCLGPSDAVLDNCKHAVCKECFENFCHNAVELTCPHAECAAPLSSDEANYWGAKLAVVTPELKEVLDIADAACPICLDNFQADIVPVVYPECLHTVCLRCTRDTYTDAKKAGTEAVCAVNGVVDNCPAVIFLFPTTPRFMHFRCGRPLRRRWKNTRTAWRRLLV